MTRSIPPEILNQHLAILGKTGAGKSHTARLAIEQAVAGGARVCILDPIKSDWWGLTSSRDGRKAGLPFHILGGPHGHVPLHSSAGKAVAEVVANGSLPLSIIDMADFEPGGPHRFFVDFAPTLLRKMRGVVYLVLEEAHLFAPKERSGIGQENLAIHWAKTLATAGRSKGIRLVLVTQRTQALHNALLGSCDTVIAHRLTAPADQAPVVQWLKANTSKAVLEQVSSSLSSLKTGEGWICAGEARLFERRQFPRIATYDNTATPTGHGQAHEVTTAAVDAEQLRALIGEAVEQAKADDPKELRKQLADKDRRIKELEAEVSKAAANMPRDMPPQVQEVHVPFIPEPVRAQVRDVLATVERFNIEVRDALIRHGQDVERELGNLSGLLSNIPRTSAQEAVTVEGVRAFGQRFEAAARQVSNPSKQAESVKRQTPTVRPSSAPASAAGGELNAYQRKTLAVLAQHGPCQKGRLALLAGYRWSGGFSNALGDLRTRGLITGANTETMAITDAGRDAAGDVPALPRGRALVDYWLNHHSFNAYQRRVLTALVDVYPEGLTKEGITTATGYAWSGGLSNALGDMRTAGVIVGKNTEVMRASEELFS